MPTDLQCHMVRDEPYALVRLVGALAPPNVSSIRDTLLTCLADQLEPVVVDVSELRVAEPAALSIFAEVAVQVADWPIVPPTVVGYRPEFLADWDKTGLAVVDSRQAAADLAARLAGWQLAAVLEPVVGAARRARELVTECCGRWELPELAGSGCIAITEMVNNVVAHARTSMVVRLALRGGLLHIGVRDHSMRQPAFNGLVPPTSAGGRGLLLIDTVARRWGASLLPDGKLVWAALHPEDEPVD